MLFRKPTLPLLRALTPSVALLSLISACSNRTISFQGPSVQAPELTGPEQKVTDYKPGESKTVVLNNKTPIQVQRVGDQLLYRLEGTFTRDSFTQIQQNIAFKPEAERRASLKQEVESVFEKAKQIGAIAQSSVPEAGYFQLMVPYESQLTHAIKKLHLDQREIVVEPVVYNKDAIKNVEDLSRAQNEELSIDPRSTHSSFSGLERIGAVEFVQLAENDIGGGVKVDGSSVQIGIADSGITYNHPTFLSRQTGKVRINYMRDFTGDGTVYINPNAKFSAEPVKDGTDEDLTISAEYIDTPKVPSSPVADDLKKIDALKIKVNAEQRALLLASNCSGAKLGIIFEERLGSDEDPVDFNANGKKNDSLYVLYIPASGNSPERVYFDSTGTADFRKSPALSDFNTSKETMKIFAEKVGFSFGDAELPSKDGKTAIKLRAVDFVGFDPGNHGTHVSGIAAGSKTIQNDSSDTLARGVAPEAKIALARVCSNSAGCSEDEGIADLVANAGAEVINLSLGGLTTSNDGFGVSETLINRLIAVKNTAFIISAGNSGPGRQTVGSPSVARLALSIGATASRDLINQQYQWPSAGNSSSVNSNEDFMLFFSSRGPSANGGFKPNLTAPGTELSSVQLNSPREVRGGLDVYWGTSMAAPTVTGAYALLLDAIKKYNVRHPQAQLTTNALDLRRVLIESARPFDVTRLDVSSGEKSKGQYTWVDEGTGMINLVGAWKKLFELRDSTPPTAITLGNQPVELDYEVVTPETAPNGNVYDGSKVVNGTPTYGAGVYLNANDSTRFKSVYISRRLPESFAGSDAAGDLTVQLRSTEDRFALRTVIYGSNETWLKAGVQESADCQNSPASDLTVIGQGVAIGVVDGKGSYSSLGASSLNLCFDREKIATLSPGDHGALIYAYRKVGSQIAPVASFIVPVFLSVPEQTLTNGSSLQYQGKLPSFGVDRHYVQVPPGTSALKITLTVPPVKLDSHGNIPAGETCSGVELMAYEGQNTSTAMDSRPQARVANCDAMTATPSNAPILDAKNRELVFTRTNPRAGLWDVHVFGQYRFPLSKYTLKVDYVTGDASVSQINGELAALQGSFDWTLKESSFAAVPDTSTSSYELTGLTSETQAKIAQEGELFVESPLGVLRSYPENVKAVTLSTGGSPGNDIDLYVIACPADAQNTSDSRCKDEGSSTGPTDEESVIFAPQAGMKYAARIEGATVNDEGKFVATEFLALSKETGKLQIQGAAPRFSIAYSFAADSSPILKDPLFTSGKYFATGTLSVKMADSTVLTALPVKIANPAQPH